MVGNVLQAKPMRTFPGTFLVNSCLFPLELLTKGIWVWAASCGLVWHSRLASWSQAAVLRAEGWRSWALTTSVVALIQWCLKPLQISIRQVNLIPLQCKSLGGRDLSHVTMVVLISTSIRRLFPKSWGLVQFDSKIRLKSTAEAHF